MQHFNIWGEPGLGPYITYSLSSSQDHRKALSASLIEGLVYESYTKYIRFVDAVSLVKINLAISPKVANLPECE